MFNLDAKQKKIFRQSVKDASVALHSNGEYRMRIAGIAAALHQKVLGRGYLYTSQEGKLLRSMFARDLGMDQKAILNWIAVKEAIVDHLEAYEIERFSYNQLFEAQAFMKEKNILDPKIGLHRYEMHWADPNKRRKKLITRYSKELLSVCRNLRNIDPNDEELSEAKHRIIECFSILEGK